MPIEIKFVTPAIDDPQPTRIEEEQAEPGEAVRWYAKRLDKILADRISTFGTKFDAGDLFDKITNPVFSGVPGQYATVADKTEQISEAQRFIKAYEQWIQEHPKEEPPPAMQERYEEERQFIASQYRVF